MLLGFDIYFQIIVVLILFTLFPPKGVEQGNRVDPSVPNMTGTGLEHWNMLAWICSISAMGADCYPVLSAQVPS